MVCNGMDVYGWRIHAYAPPIYTHTVADHAHSPIFGSVESSTGGHPLSSCETMKALTGLPQLVKIVLTTEDADEPQRPTWHVVRASCSLHVGTAGALH